MKKLLLLLLLFGVNANGASPSLTGLEGFGKDGIKIIVEDYSDDDKTFDKKAIENQVKLRLVQAGIKVTDNPLMRLDINAQPTKGGLISLHIACERLVYFKSNDKEYACFATVWDTGGTVGKKNLRDAMNNIMDEFLLTYLKANPKKKED